jgi:tetrahydromethanopterin S-methyltransferase subunit E
MIGDEDHACVSESLAHCSLISIVEFGLKFCFAANLGFQVTIYVLPTYCIELFSGRQNGAALSSSQVGKPVLAGAVSSV